MMPDGLMNTRDAATFTGLAVSTLESFRSVGGGPPFAKLGRVVRYRAADLDAWIASRVVTKTAERSPPANPRPSLPAADVIRFPQAPASNVPPQITLPLPEDAVVSISESENRFSVYIQRRPGSSYSICASDYRAVGGSETKAEALRIAVALADRFDLEIVDEIARCGRGNHMELNAQRGPIAEVVPLPQRLPPGIDPPLGIRVASIAQSAAEIAAGAPQGWYLEFHYPVTITGPRWAPGAPQDGIDYTSEAEATEVADWLARGWRCPVEPAVVHPADRPPNFRTQPDYTRARISPSE